MKRSQKQHKYLDKYFFYNQQNRESSVCLFWEGIEAKRQKYEIWQNVTLS